MQDWPAHRNAEPGTLVQAIQEVAGQHKDVDPRQIVWWEFDREDALRTQFQMNYWIADLECKLGKRGASSTYEKEPIMKIHVKIDDSAMQYFPQLRVYFP